MKISMAQLSMTENMDENLKKTLEFTEKARGSDLLFFPEIQLTPFFPQYPGRDVDKYVLAPDDSRIQALCKKSAELGMYISPNVYLALEGGRFDASLWITPGSGVAGIAKMVHITQARQFCERDYYTPSDDGFKVFDTPFGKVGIVICFDRHLPESVRTCALMGAELIIIPTANTASEPLEMFEWELRVQAMQSNVFIAMCNRVGREDEMDFAGESIIVGPDGDVIIKAGGGEELVSAEIDLSLAGESRKRRPYIHTRRPEFYL